MQCSLCSRENDGTSLCATVRRPHTSSIQQLWSPTPCWALGANKLDKGAVSLGPLHHCPLCLDGSEPLCMADSSCLSRSWLKCHLLAWASQSRKVPLSLYDPVLVLCTAQSSLSFYLFAICLSHCLLQEDRDLIRPVHCCIPGT